MLFFIFFLLLAIGSRWACGRICPLGLLEEWIFKIPFPRKYTSLPWDRQLRKGKYAIFFLLLIAIPTLLLPNKEAYRPLFLVVKVFGFSSIFLLSLILYRRICKYLCPFGSFSASLTSAPPIATK